MIINFTPQRRDDILILKKIDVDKIEINGDIFDFSSLNEGDFIPSGIVPCEWIVGEIRKVENKINLTIILPHGPTPNQALAFPQPINFNKKGQKLIFQPTEQDGVINNVET